MTTWGGIRRRRQVISWIPFDHPNWGSSRLVNFLYSLVGRKVTGSPMLLFCHQCTASFFSEGDRIGRRATAIMNNRHRREPRDATRPVNVFLSKCNAT